MEDADAAKPAVSSSNKGARNPMPSSSKGAELMDIDPVAQNPVPSSSNQPAEASKESMDFQSLLAELPSASQKPKRKPPVDFGVTKELFDRRVKQIKEKEAEAAKLAAEKAKEVEGNKRPRANSPEEPKKKIRERAEVSGFRFKDVVVHKSRRCGMQVNGGHVVGDPYKALAGYQVNFRIDGGRYGQPSLNIIIRVNKGDRTKPLDIKDENVDSFTLTWYPGVKVNGAYMMDKWDPAPLSEHGIANFPKQYLVDREKEDLLKTIVIKFRSISHITKSANFTATEGLESEVAKTFQSLFADAGAYGLVIWFTCPYKVSPEDFWNQSLVFFNRCVEERLPPLMQYYDKEAQPVLDLESTTPIKYFQDGMYNNYMTKREGKNKPVPDLEKEPVFFQLATKTTWESLEEFRIYASLPVIRDFQFTKGRMSKFADSRHRVFLKSAPSFVINGKRVEANRTLTQEQVQFKKLLFAYVRLAVSKDGMKEAVPEEGCRVTLKWARGTEELPWFGDVVRCRDKDLLATGTNLCIALTKPAKAGERRTYTDLHNLASEKLHEAYINIEVSKGPAYRELNGVKVLVRPGQQRGSPESDENVERYRNSLARVRQSTDMNNQQFELLKTPSRVVNNICIVQGCPGTGKTSICAFMIWLLVGVGHKLLVVAPSNGAVDAIASKVWGLRPNYLESKKLLRLEIGSVEDQAILSRDQDFTESNVNAETYGKKVSSFEDHPDYQHVMNKMVNELEADDAAFAKFSEQKDDFEDAYEKF